MAEHPRHGVAFDQLTTAWEAAGGLATEYSSFAPRRPNRLAKALVSAAAAIAVMVGAGTAWMVLDSGTAYATQPGETRRLSFPDGSTVILDSGSAIQVKLKPSRRDFQLRRGRAHFEVAKDPRRPFVVTAGARQVFALGTVFDVARTQSSTTVLLIEGRVAVQSTSLLSGQDAPRFMIAGERLTLADDGASQDDRPDMVKLTAWQNGQAIFDNDTLASAVAELNRYSRKPIVIADPSLSEMRVSGVFRSGATVDFANSVSNLLPIKVRTDADRIVMQKQGPTG